MSSAYNCNVVSTQIEHGVIQAVSQVGVHGYLLLIVLILNKTYIGGLA